MHYVLSDIHGQYNKFLEILKKTEYDSSKDSMYILGDAIDRGPDGIKCLQHIKNDESMHLIIGNHEDMMIKTYRQRKNRLLYPESWWRIWLQNGSHPTTKGIKTLSEEEQSDLLDWLETLPLVIPNLVVNGQFYYLVHACNLHYEVEDVLYYKDATEDDIYTCVWDRFYGTSFFIDYFDKCFSMISPMYKDSVLMFGHTPIIYTDYAVYEDDNKKKPKIVHLVDGRCVNLDCGCACDLRLGCMRLEDSEEFYA